MLGLTLSYINDLDIGKRSRAAAIGLLFYDHLINLDREIELVWMKDKRRPAFYLYIFNRLFAFSYYVFDTVPITPSGTVASNICVIYLMCDALVTLVATIMVQVILQLRIYALYQRNRRVLIFLLTLCAVEASVMAVLVGFTMSSLTRIPLVSTPTGCAYQGILTVYALFWIPGLVFEPMLFALVARKAWDDNPTIPLIRHMARDSLMYFAVTFTELLVNTVIWARYPQYINIVNPWSAAIPSLLGSRLLLGMRKFVEQQNNDGNSYILETYDASHARPDRDDSTVAWNIESEYELQDQETTGVGQASSSLSDSLKPPMEGQVERRKSKDSSATVLASAS